MVLDPVLCAECGATYDKRFLSYGRCLRCGSARLVEQLTDDGPEPVSGPANFAVANTNVFVCTAA